MSGATVAECAPTTAAPAVPKPQWQITTPREVRALSELLSAELDDGETVVEFDSRPATAVGDNYGSCMLALDVTVRAAGGGERHLHAFCKMIPDDPEMQEIFMVKVTLVKELQMYTLAVPAMLQLQRDYNVPEEDFVTNLFPRCYGARISLGSQDVVDEDGAIVLEDMRQRGFATGDRHQGLDLAHAMLAMKKLAVFHALPVALRLKRPQVFEETVKKACRHFSPMKADHEEKFLAAIMANMRKVPELAVHEEAVERLCREWNIEALAPVRETFASVLHNDLWTNNVLFRKAEDLVPLEMAFIDFQMTRINSPFKDVVFFLFTSVQSEVCQQQYDELIKTYLDSFCRCLRQVDVDTKPFSAEAAREELNAVAVTELFHILSMLRFVLADPKMVRENPAEFPFREDLGGERFTQKLKHVVEMYAALGWLT